MAILAEVDGPPLIGGLGRTAQPGIMDDADRHFRRAAIVIASPTLIVEGGGPRRIGLAHRRVGAGKKAAP